MDEWVRASRSGDPSSNPTDAALKRGRVRLPPLPRDASSISEKDGSRSQPKRVYFC